MQRPVVIHSFIKGCTKIATTRTSWSLLCSSVVTIISLSVLQQVSFSLSVASLQNLKILFGHSPTGWQRPIGCRKMQVIFAKEPLIIGLFCEK